ncbi:MAG: DUF1624 domain-containing protein [Phycisphaerae bacterium]|nr:DUF1624 domain-containing protein [Phycisphaerae bacterium]
MEEPAPLPKPRRLISLDVFRGITIAGMILVNNPGSWGKIYGPLEHAHWNGCTPTDLVFPFFLFIVGVAMAFSFDKRITAGFSRGQLLTQAIRRGVIIFLLGLCMYGFPDWRLIAPFVMAIVGLALFFADEPEFGLPISTLGRLRKIIGAAVFGAAIAYFAVHFDYFQDKGLRVPGVLQRIGVCYILASIIAVTCNTWLRAAWVVVILAGYWIIMATISPPAGYTANVVDASGLLHNWIDEQLLSGHLYRERPDPEGVLSTLPAVATVLLGLLTGQWLQTKRERHTILIGLFVAANVALFVALCMKLEMPFNKKIWTSSYVVLTAGLALHFLAMCYWLIDVRGVRWWSWPFVVFGSNAIVVFVASSLLAKMMGRWQHVMPDGTTTSVKNWIYQDFFVSWAGEMNGSLAFPICYIIAWLIPMIVLYKLRIFVKV